MDSTPTPPSPTRALLESAEKHPIRVFVGAVALTFAVTGYFFIQKLDQKDLSIVNRDEVHQLEIKKLEFERLRTTPPPTSTETPGAFDALNSWLKNEDPAKRVSALRLIAANKADEQFLIPVVGASLLDKDSSVRAAATTALGLFRDDSGVVGELIAAMLGDPDQDVRSAAVVALSSGWQGAPDSAIKALTLVFRDETSPVFLRVSAGEAVLHINEESATELVQSSIRSPKRVSAVAALVAARSPGQLTLTASEISSAVEEHIPDLFADAAAFPDPRARFNTRFKDSIFYMVWSLDNLGDESLATQLENAEGPESLRLKLLAKSIRSRVQREAVTKAAAKAAKVSQ